MVCVAKIFSEVYDARQEYHAKSEMLYWNVVGLKIHDLVLLEVHISRFRLKSDEENREWKIQACSKQVGDVEGTV